MSKVVEYPSASFKAAQELANSADSLGGSSSSELCAEKMGNKLGGGFTNIISSAQKFKLINYKSGQITTSSLFRDIKLSYTEEEKMRLLITSFLSPPVFFRLYERFKGKELPISMLEKMLIKEYAVDDNAASRIKKYFIDGAKSVGLLDSQNHLIAIETDKKENSSVVEIEEIEIIPESNNSINETSSNVISLSDLDEFVFHITGPGINSRIAIREEEDFIILEAMIRKIKKRFDFNSN
ncbi:MAG: hypothetical protein ACHQHN_05500 [Sphingobacteriales bacterium]